MTTDEAQDMLIQNGISGARVWGARHAWLVSGNVGDMTFTVERRELEDAVAIACRCSESVLAPDLHKYKRSLGISV